MLAGRYLRAKRSQGGVALISIISFVGIMLAVAVLIIVMSVMNGFRTELLDRTLGFNGHIFVSGGSLVEPDVQRLAGEIAGLPGVTQAAPLVEAQAMALGQGQISGVVVRGISAADLRATQIVSGNIVRGSLEGFGEGEYGGDLIVIGERLAQTLGVQPGDPLTLISPSGGATAFGFTPQRKTYTVAATFTVGMSEYDQLFIYMPLAQAQLFFGREGVVDVVEIRVADADRAMEMKSQIAELAGPTAIVTDWTQRNASFWNALKVERSVMRLILMLIVAIAAMNIISGLVMLVKNKGRDIAILRTMGAGRGAILRVFFMAGASVGALGTLVGLVLGVLFCLFIGPIQSFVEWVTGAEVFSSDIYYLAHIPAQVDWREVLIIVAWALGVSFVATLPPALRASRLDPVEALRYE
ncbi:lipoprotein-releasing ABC transporter permease subunit [Phenylobacterium sp.]|uniref:lipoprotein-releasing ABC transporter permease subunit n=1 Tax=Phenylobacterium sp. TaxID=1871053 RepID=UPI0008CA177E|nr:lipoprotein-releasing ABC transporter permease subunit [Phenylobacterium sp.]MBA4792593.1 lipoprotein-releasing ABC transporter permease subunit [Phenylobacterium sp.]OHB33426.1 MAG: multidrug ABC transporter substrate-binding protein [Phenylobacterium sp. RIFCSPHIGHO2_01_FULL_70_10]